MSFGADDPQRFGAVAVNATMARVRDIGELETAI
jgi:hypothetical protein